MAIYRNPTHLLVKTIVTISCLAILILQESCKNNSTGKSSVTIHGITTSPINVKLLSSDMVSREPVVLAEGLLDSSRRSLKLETAMRTPQFVKLSISNKDYELYLSPGTELTGTLNQGSNSEPIMFTGKGSAENNYLSRVASVSNAIKNANNKLFFALTPEQFAGRVDSLQFRLQEFHKSYCDSLGDNMSEDSKVMLQQRNELDVQYTKLFYSYFLANNNLVEQFEALRNEYTFKASELPAWLSETERMVRLDSLLLNSRMPLYAQVMELLLQRTIYQPFMSATTWTTEKDHFPVAAAARIKDKGFPKPFDEYMAARNINYWMGRYGLFDAVDTIFNDFRKEFPKSAYLSILETEYDKNTVLFAESKKASFTDSRETYEKLIGLDAPDIIGSTTDGKLVSLADFKGKVIYIDFWTTWCGPCRKEAPYAKRLKAEFDSVVFFNVSFDESLEAWTKLLASASDLYGGVNVHLEDGHLRQVKDDYQVSYYPRYILVDKSGKIVNANAPRPSSGMAAAALRRLL